MAIPKWALKSLQEDIDAGRLSYDNLGETARSKLSAPTYNAEPDTQSMADFRQMERDTPMPEISSNTLDSFVAKENPEFVANNPVLSKALAIPAYGLQNLADLFPQPVQDWANRAGQTGGEVMTMVDNPNKATTGNRIGDISADLVGGLMGFMNPEGAGAKLWKGAEDLIGGATTRLIPQAPKLAQDALKIGGATIPYELTNAYVNNRSINPEDAGLAVGSNLLLAGLTHGLGRLGRSKAQAPAELPDSDLIFGDTAKPDAVKPTPVLERMQGNYQGLNMPRTQAEKALPDNLLLNQMRNTFEGIPNREPTPLPRVPALNRNVDMASLPNKYPLPDVGNLEGKAWNNMTWQERNNRIHPPEELVTVNKINSADKIGASLPKGDPYNKLIAEEINRLKSEGKQGVVKGGIGFSNEGEVVNRWGNMSLNPKWYQELYKANINEKYPKGRPPTAEQYKKLAIENLRNGTEHYDGTPIPANAEFLALERGMQTGKQMPEEWTNLEKIINVINENKEYSYSEKAQAIAQLRAEQDRFLSQVEQPATLPQAAAGDNMGNRLNYKNEALPADQQDLIVLQAASQRKMGPFTINKAELAPEALQRPEFQAAATIANKLGLRLVPYKGSGPRGIQYGRSIYLNEKLTDPVDYLFWHEVGHSMEVTHAEHYGRLMDIANEHVADAAGVDKHYLEQGYAADKRPHEFAADVFAEALSTPGFFARIAEQSPELIKPLLEAIDRMIQQVKGMVSKDDTILPYLKNIETLRERVRQEVATPYFKDAMGEKQFVETFGDQWQDAAKLDRNPTGGKINPTNNGLGDGVMTQPLNKRLRGDKLLDAEDLIAEIKDNGGMVDENGYVTLFHRTDKQSANAIISTGKMKAKEDGVFFSTRADGQNTGYGDTLIEFKVPVEKLELDDVFGNEAHLRIPLRDRVQVANVKEYLVGNTTRPGNTGPGEKKIRTNNQEAPGNGGFFNGDINLKAERTQADNLRDMVLAGARQIPKSGGFTQHFKDNLLAAYPTLNEAQLKFLYDRGVELRKGQTAFKSQGEVVRLRKKDLAEPTVAKKATTENWNHVTSKTTRGPIKARDITDKTYAAVFDNLDRLKQLDNLSSRVNNPSDRAYLLALNSREAGGTAKNIVEKGLVDPQGNEIGQSLASITKQLPKGTADDFANYLVYRHAPSWLESGKQVFPKEEGITADVARQRAAAYEQAHPEFKQIGDNLIQWQKDFKKAWLVDTGIIKPQEWDAMSQMYPDYVPLRRKMEDIEQGSMGGLKKGFANQSSPIKKATGSQREIINPIESIIEDTYRIVKIARRNEVMQAIDRNIRQDPEAVKGWIEILPEKGEAFESAAAKDGIDGFINWLEEPFDQMVARKNIKYDKPNVVRSRVNGETVHYQVKDPALLNALTNLTPQGTNTVIEAARQVTRTMKILTTGSNPIFATRNMARDLPMAYIGSNTLTKTPMAREVQFAWGIIDSFARIVTGGRYDPGQYYKTFKAMGGGSHSSAMASDRNLLAESKAKILPGYYDASKPLTTAGRGIKAIGRGVEAFTNAGETIPRLPEYVRTVKKGGDTAASRQQGLFNAQDVTVNFSKHGSVSKDADAVVPYLNAALQGIDKLGRIYTSNPAEAIQRSIIAVSVPTIWLWNINHDNPDYQKLSNYVKDNYFCLPMGNGKFVKIAKPRETGVVFSSLVERALRKWADDDPNGFKGFSEAWSKNFAPPYRWLGAPMTDIVSNKNFAGSPIVPGYQQRLSPELQYDENTSAPAKAIGKTLGMSPKKLDYVARSYTGVLGELGIPAASEGRGESTGQRVGNVIGKTFTADPLYSNDIMTNFYDAKDRLDLANSDFKATKQKSPDYNPNKARIMNSAADKISDLNKQIRTVNSNKGMTYEAKDRRVRDLKQRSQNIAEQALARIGAVK